MAALQENDEEHIGEMRKERMVSRPKYYWYGISRKMINRYPKLNKARPMEKKFKEAIDRQMLTMLDTDEGQEKVKVIQAVCFEHRAAEEIAEETFYSERTIQRWINDFVNSVGKRVGF